MKRAALAVLGLALLAPCALAQMTTSKSVLLTATVPGHVTLSVSVLDLHVAYDPARSQNSVSVPVQLDWSLNPVEVHGFRLVARFTDASKAFANERDAIPATAVSARLSAGEFQRFRDGRAVLLNQPVVVGAYRGSRNDMVDVQLDPGFNAGTYAGVLLLQVQEY